jgi:hypothetical protein
MSHLNEYPVQRHAALFERKGRIEAGKLGPSPLAASVSAEGRSGVRRIRIRDFQVISDSPPDFAGYNLGASSPELQLGVFRGAEIGVNCTKNPDGSLRASKPVRLNPGDVTAVSPRIGDIHTIANAYDDRVSISIHVYGGNIGRIHRAVIDPATGIEKEFISGYSNTTISNLWTELAVA